MEDLRKIRKRWRDYLRLQTSCDPDISVGLAGSFTLDPLAPYLGEQFLDVGYDNPDIKIAGYNQIIQTCLSPETEFGDKRLDAIVLIWRLEDIADSQNVSPVEDAVNLFFEAVEQLHTNFGGTIILALPPMPSARHDLVLNFSQPRQDVNIWHQVCSLMTERFSDRDRLYFIDFGEIITHIGEAAYDSRKHFLYRQPFSEGVYAHLASSITRIVKARRREPKKCLVLDCDNTLWGGIVGEDGVGGVQIGDDYPGSVFKAVQRQVRALKESGIFITLNSKNNEDEALAVFDRRSEMALKKDDVIISKVNWQPKSENLKEIATELNIGLDALVFVDDNPFEIEEVKTNAPGVTCFLVPEELAEYPAMMKEQCKLFDRLVITEDDHKRVARMQNEKGRKDAAKKLTPEEFLAELDLQVFVYPPNIEDLARVTQLINKTNQFNVLTRRYTFEEVAAYVQNEDNLLFCMSVADKFGEYGLVGVVMVSRRGKDWRIENLLMSCRVLGRGVETTLLAHISDELLAMGGAQLCGGYARTPKNQLVADLFERHGFERIQDEKSRDGVEGWTAPLPLKCAVPSYVDLHPHHPQAG